MLAKLLKAWLPVAAMCLVIFLLSQDSSSGRHSDAVLGWLLTIVGMNTPHLRHLLDPHFRKFAHVFVYFCLGGLAYRGFALGRIRFAWSAAVRTVIFCCVYAITDEYHQSFVNGRGDFEPSDVVRDTAGAILAMLLIWLWMRYRHPGRDSDQMHGVGVIESA